MVQWAAYLGLAGLAATALAHPGGDVRAEFRAREEHLNNPQRRTMGSCRRSLEESGHFEGELSRRMEKIGNIRRGLGLANPSGPVLDKRQARAGCVLDPEVTEGPFWVQGELIREDIREKAPGVVLHLDVNVIDVSTCKPIPDVYVELWGCNSTGVYTGVVSKGNGNGVAAPEEIKNSALRGIQATNGKGVASFVTVVPGHYVGRANHLHTIIHHGASKLENNTIRGGTISHVGQFYFEQALLRSVEGNMPYATNKQVLTTNAADFLYKQGFGNGDNPVIDITMLGASVADGLHGVIDVGVDPRAVRKPQPVNMWTKAGGVPVPGSPWSGYPWTKAVRKWLGL
ncbi:hypothetical protein RB597_009394 [Gaeumannomyces tritici]